MSAEELGRIFRCMYPGGQGRHANTKTPFTLLTILITHKEILSLLHSHNFFISHSFSLQNAKQKPKTKKILHFFMNYTSICFLSILFFQTIFFGKNI